MSEQGRMYLLLYDKMKALLIRIRDTTVSAHWARLSGACRRTTLQKVFYLDHHLHHNNNEVSSSQSFPIGSDLMWSSWTWWSGQMPERGGSLWDLSHLLNPDGSSAPQYLLPRHLQVSPVLTAIVNSTFSLIDSLQAWHRHIASLFIKKKLN